jgi:hypothetical protein
MIWLLLLEVDAPRRDPADRLDPAPIVAQVRQLLTESREAWIQTQIVASDEVEQRTKSAHWRRHHESNMRLYGVVGWTPKVVTFTRQWWGWTHQQATELVEDLHGWRPTD